MKGNKGFYQPQNSREAALFTLVAFGVFLTVIGLVSIAGLTMLEYIRTKMDF